MISQGALSQSKVLLQSEFNEHFREHYSLKKAENGMKRILEVKDLNTRTKNGIDLHGINFSLKESELHALIGERGVGKGLFVDVLLGKEKSFSGEIFFQGKKIEKSFEQIQRKEAFFLLRRPSLANDLTVYENIFLMEDPKKIFRLFSRRKLKKRSDALLAELGLGVKSKTFVNTLTNEEKKNVEIAKMYYFKPPVVVLLEPTEYLTKASRELLLKVIRELKEMGTGFIYVTNKWEEALQYADRLTVISSGRLKGEMLSCEAKKRPEKLISLISGFSSKTNSTSEKDLIHSDTDDIIEAVFKAAEFLTSNYELNDVLSMLTRYSTKILESDGCNVYLIDEKSQSIIDIIGYKRRDEIYTTIKPEAVMDIMRKDSLYHNNADSDDFSKLFKRINHVKTVICYPVLIRSHYTALIEVFYQDKYIQTEKQKKILLALSKQAAVAIENTRLLGKSTLLQETHHRIKNNLQTIISLIKLQKSNFHRSPEKNIDKLVNNVVLRIKSIAIIHDLLSKDVVGRSIVNIKTLILALLKFHMLDERPEIITRIEDIFIPYNKTTSIALIINELINNCYKHAFKEPENGVIRITCKKTDEQLEISIEDNGVGLPKGFNIDKLNSLGLFIVNSLVKNEFNGTFFFSGEDGTKLIIRIPRERILISSD